VDCVDSVDYFKKQLLFMFISGKKVKLKQRKENCYNNMYSCSIELHSLETVYIHLCTLRHKTFQQVSNELYTESVTDIGQTVQLTDGYLNSNTCKTAGIIQKLKRNV